MQCEEIIIPWKQNSFQKNGNQKNGNANGPFIFAQVALRCLLCSQVLTELGLFGPEALQSCFRAKFRVMIIQCEEIDSLLYPGNKTPSKKMGTKKMETQTAHLFSLKLRCVAFSLLRC